MKTEFNLKEFLELSPTYLDGTFSIEVTTKDGVTVWDHVNSVFYGSSLEESYIDFASGRSHIHHNEIANLSIKKTITKDR